MCAALTWAAVHLHLGVSLLSFAGMHEATGGFSQCATVKPRTPHSSVGEQCGRHFHSLNRKAQRTSALQSLGAERNGGCESKHLILLSTSHWKLSPCPCILY